MAKKDIMRKCQSCDEKGNRTINLENDKYIVLKNGKSNKFWHFDCYIEYYLKKQKVSYEEALEFANNTYENQYDSSLQKSRFFSWLIDYHCANSLSSYIYKRVDEIVCGVYKDMKEGISYEDLLEMYKKQASKLDSIAIGKSMKGNGFKDINSRVLYDLAILVGKYDSFKKWKIKQRLLSLENESIKNNLKNEKNNVNINDVVRKNKKNDIEDIDLDELF